MLTDKVKLAAMKTIEGRTLAELEAIARAGVDALKAKNWNGRPPAPTPNIKGRKRDVGTLTLSGGTGNLQNLPR